MTAPSKEAHSKFAVPDIGEVSALWLCPASARWLLVLAHGAGAGMNHPFLGKLAAELASVEVATFRYQFPYVEKRIRRIDPQPILLATVRAAVEAAAATAPDLQLLAGGKSMGGRMTSLASAAEALPGVRGLVFFGFPLHPAGAPAVTRAEHLERVQTPMLFLQGTRDKLGDLDLLRPIIDRLAPRASIHIVEGADHSFEVPKRSGRNLADVLEELAGTVSSWAASLT